MPPLTSQFSVSVAPRDQVVKKTCVGTNPSTAFATPSVYTLYETSPRILITGSLYLAGHVLDINGTPPG